MDLILGNQSTASSEYSNKSAFDERMTSLEKQLNIEQKVREGAENMIQSYRSGSGRDKKILADAEQMLQDSKAKIDYLKMRISKARQNRADYPAGGSFGIGPRRGMRLL
jgi:chromosome segregation ATPase